MSKSTRRFWVRWEWMSSTLWMFVAMLVILKNQFSQCIIFYFLPTSSKVQAIRLFSSETVELNIEHLFVRVLKSFSFSHYLRMIRRLWFSGEPQIWLSFLFYFVSFRYPYFRPINQTIRKNSGTETEKFFEIVRITWKIRQLI
jgi:hypothetical protein